MSFLGGYDQKPEEFGRELKKFAQAGLVNMVGMS